MNPLSTRDRGVSPRHTIRLGFALLLFLVTSSCDTASYYAQAVRGQFEIFDKQRPIPEVIADPNTKPELKTRLELVEEIRAFALGRLALPGAKSHYLRYADLGRPFVVWNVFAAPEFDLEPHTWRYPIVGRLSYRGYFSKAPAVALAKELADEGMDSTVGGVVAYSTLGYFRDPLLNTFIGQREIDFTGLLFHELTHHRFFLKGDTTFSEGLATAVEEEGLRLWIEHKADPKLKREYDIYLRRHRDFVSLITQTHDELGALYKDSKKDTPEEIATLRDAKTKAFADLKARYRRMKATRWDSYDGFDKWFERDLNNAHINAVSTYFDLVPGFKKLLADSDHDFDAFFDSIEALAKKPKAKRDRILTLP